MSTSYTNLLGFALPTSGELDGAWGDVVNASVTELVEDAIAGSATASVASADWTLSTTGSGSTNQARSAILIPTGTPGTARSIFAPNSSKAYIVHNQSNAAVTIKGATGPTAGATITAGTAALVAWNGSDFVIVAQDLTNSTGTLPVSKGGTGQTSYTDGQLLIGNSTGNTLAKATLTAGTGISITNGAGSVTIASTVATGVTSVSGTGSVNGITLSGTVTSTGSLTLGGALSGVGLSSQVTGVLPAANGGTGLSAVGASGNVLTSNGTAWVSSAPSSALSGFTDSATPFETSLGYQAGNVNTGVRNTFIGYQSGLVNTSGVNNTAVGYNTLLANTGNSNNAFGALALSSNSTGAANTAMGYVALLSNTTGTYNTALGNGSLQSNTINDSNVAIGSSALNSSDSAKNVAVGANALVSLTSGASNTAIGYAAGFGLSTGSNNTIIGNEAVAASVSSSNTVTLGNSSITTLRCQVTTITALSDARDKTDVKALNAGLDFVNELKPVSFTWNMRDGGKIDVLDTGFIAQDLQAVQTKTGITIPGLVDTENPDRLEAGYGKLLPVLVKAIQELSEQVQSLKKEISDLKGA